MSRRQGFFDILVTHDLRPSLDDNGLICFEFERCRMFLDAPEDHEYIYFGVEFESSIFNNFSSDVALAVNAIVRRNRELTGWFDESSATIAIGSFCREPGSLERYLNDLLATLSSAADDLEMCAYDVEYFRSFVNNEPARFSFLEQMKVDQAKRVEAVLMNPSSETLRKLRWEGNVGGTILSLYIPKQRVPVPWPKQIIVAVSYPMRTGGTLHRTDENEELDRRLPIVAVLKRDAERKHTVRYRPIGDPDEWEIGTTYFPYSMLPDREAETIQIEVRWDTSAGIWSE